MAPRVHPGLLSLIDSKLAEATSAENESDYVNPRLKNDILDQIKENNLSVSYYEKMMKQMEKKDSKTRNSAFQLLSSLALHSSKARYLYVRDLHHIVDLVMGVLSPVPETDHSMLDLRTRLIENMEIMKSRFGKEYPHFSICLEYLRGLQHNEFLNRKRMREETSQFAPPSKRKQHSLSILTEVVNQTIWNLYKHMDFFEYEYDVTIEMDAPKKEGTCCITKDLSYIALGAILDSIWDDEGDTLSSYRTDTPAQHESKPAVSSTDMKRAYDEMTKAQKSIQNEIIPTLERNVALLKAKGTEKSRITLEKIEDMLDRCVIASKRCTRLLHMGNERYGNRDDDPLSVSLYFCSNDQKNDDTSTPIPRPHNERPSHVVY